MGSKIQIQALFSFVILLFATSMAAEFNILKYGAKTDGRTDISGALLEAWKAACESSTPSVVVIPKGEFISGLAKLRGPCNAPIKIQANGIIKAPPSLSGDSWIVINHVNNFVLFGTGTFDGQGPQAWKLNECHKTANCKALPYNFRFHFVNNSKITGVTSLNSKNFHVNVLGSKNVLFEKFTIITPAESPNTDGIHIGRSSYINITDCILQTGDDCVSIGDDSQQISVTRVKCGPGHGISIGSLGKYQNEGPVDGIYVKDCTLTNTDNGVRIKSWPDMFGGSATNIRFENIIMNNVSNPIIIDQVYCPWNQCSKKSPSKVKVSDITFSNIRGTTPTEMSVQLLCSSGIPCKNVVLNGIELAYTGKVGKAVSVCSNVKPIIRGPLKPSGCVGA